jgi:hypothetical protein
MTANRFTRSRHDGTVTTTAFEALELSVVAWTKVMSRSAQPVSVAVATNRPELGDKIRLIPAAATTRQSKLAVPAAGDGREADAVARIEGSRIRSTHSSGIPASRRPAK